MGSRNHFLGPYFSFTKVVVISLSGGKKCHTDEKLLQLVDHEYEHSKMSFPRNFFKKKCLKLNQKNSIFCLSEILKCHPGCRDGISVTPTQQTCPSLNKQLSVLGRIFPSSTYPTNASSRGQYWTFTRPSNFSSEWYLGPPGPTQTLRDAMTNFDLTPSSGYGHMLDQLLKSNKAEYCVLWTYWCILSVSPDTKFDQTLLDPNAFRLS